MALFGRCTGRPNMSSSWNWSSCLRSPSRQSDQFSRVLSFRQVNEPRACSAGVMALDCRAFRVRCKKSSGMAALDVSRPKCRAVIARMVTRSIEALLVVGSGAKRLCLSNSFHRKDQLALASWAKVMQKVDCEEDLMVDRASRAEALSKTGMSLMDVTKAPRILF